MIFRWRGNGRPAERVVFQFDGHKLKLGPSQISDELADLRQRMRAVIDKPIEIREEEPDGPEAA